MSEKSEKKKILIADDVPNILKLVSFNIKALGYEAVMARDGDEVLEELEYHNDIHAVLLDIKMPKKSGLDVLKIIRERYPHLPVIMVTALYDVKIAVQAIKMGAYEYITKPIDFERLETVLRNAMDLEKLKKEVKTLRHHLNENELFTEIIGESKRLQQVFKMVEKVMQTNANVLIIGESGTGKELLARALHNGSNRREGPFVTVNCAAITQQLAESLLFGHKKGAFTGAHSDSVGYFEQANGGTIFLDEIGDMPLDIQAKVLRVLEDRRIQRVGEQKIKEVDFRVIAATNRDLADAVAESQFREDLYFRLEEYPVYLPALRERDEDIPILANYFLKELTDDENLEPMQFAETALELLKTHTWPGNIRELKNVVRRSALKSSNGVIKKIEFTRMSSPARREGKYQTPKKPFSRRDITPIEEMERAEIQKAYHFADKNAAEAARLLGISRATMYRKLKDYQVD